MPAVAGGIVDVVAVPVVAAGAAPGFLQNAAVQPTPDRVRACELAVRGADFPLPEPEIELAVLRSRARLRIGRLPRCSEGCRDSCGQGREPDKGRTMGAPGHSVTPTWRILPLRRSGPPGARAVARRLTGGTPQSRRSSSPSPPGGRRFARRRGPRIAWGREPARTAFGRGRTGSPHPPGRAGTAWARRPPGSCPPRRTGSA